MADATTSASPPPQAAAGATDMLISLAVRDWVNPFDLVNAVAEKRAGQPAQDPSAALAAVAPDVETAPSEKRGAWWLSAEARRRTLRMQPARRIRSEIRSPLLEADRRDPIFRAFRQVYGFDRRKLQSLSDSELHAIDQVSEWIGPDAPAVPPSAVLASVRASRDRADDIARLTETQVFGRDEILNEIEQQVGKAFKVGKVPRAVCVWGEGGAGKSTILALFEKRLQAKHPKSIVIHLDFDRVDLDPFAPILLDLELLRQLPITKPDEAREIENRRAHLAQILAGIRADIAAARKAGESWQAEAVAERMMGERSSLMYHALVRVTKEKRPVALVFDTAEVVEAQGQSAVNALTAWANSLIHTVGIGDLRILVASRSSPSVGVEWFAGIRSVQLPELTVRDAQRMLVAHGIDDQALASSAAEVLPRNPLILKIAADIYKERPEYLEEVRSALNNRSIDRETASRYLAERIVKHIPDALAKRYALGAMLLPRVTPQLLERVVIPAVDDISTESSGRDARGTRGRAQRVFKSLLRVRWLIAPALDELSFVYPLALQKLILDLMSADPVHASLAKKVHRQGIQWHDGRRKADERALALYHRAMLGERISGRDRPVLPPDVTRLLPILPNDARAILQGSATPGGEAAVIESDQPKVASAHSFETATDEEWRNYLEGRGSSVGQGDRLVGRGRLIEALEMYRNRPTRSAGSPPTFVIEALTDAALWETGEIDVPSIIGELKQSLAQAKGISPQELKRVYWIVRYCLVSDPRSAPALVRPLLDMIFERLSRGSAFAVASLATVVEALSPKDGMIVPDSWLRRKGRIEAETRIFLVHYLYFSETRGFSPNLEALAVAQKNWLARFDEPGSKRQRVNSRVGFAAPRSAQRPGAFYLPSDAQKRLLKLNGARFANVSGVLRSMRRPVSIRLEELDRMSAVDLLRGLTPGFHRPLRHALAAVWPNADDYGNPNSERIVISILRTVSEQMTIRPREFAMDRLRKLVDGDSAAWLTSFVQFADRARLLPFLAQTILKTKGKSPAADRLRAVAANFVSWDKVLGGGRTTEWPK